MKNKLKAATAEEIESARRKLLKGKRYQVIADATGLSYFWLSRFATGRIQNPRAENFLRLRNYLDGNAADLIKPIRLKGER